MSDYIAHTFVKTDDTGFSAEFIDFIIKRNIYLTLLQQHYNTQRLFDTALSVGVVLPANPSRPFIPGHTKINYKAGTNPGKIAKFEEMLVRNEAKIEQALLEDNEGALEMRLGLRAKLINMAEGLDDSAAILEMFKQALGSLTPAEISLILGNQGNNNSLNKELLAAKLAFLRAGVMLVAAIETDIGKDYKIVKWIATTLATWKLPDADDLILKLLEPFIRTDIGDADNDLTAILRSTLNPNNIQIGARFNWGTAIPYDFVAPANRFDIGKGIENVAFSANIGNLNPNTIYHFQIVALSKYLGLFFGNDRTFLTPQGPSSFTVTFDGNGNDSGSMELQEANEPTALTSNGFALTGFAFKEWNTLANGNGITYTDGVIYAFDEDITLYAQWAHRVIFDGNGADGGSMSPQYSNEPQILYPNDFTLTGFSFNGWNTNADGSGTAYADSDPYAFNSNVTLYAQWT